MATTPDEMARLVRLAINARWSGGGEQRIELAEHCLVILWQPDRIMPVIVSTSDGNGMEDYFVAVDEGVLHTADGGALGLTAREIDALSTYREAATAWRDHMLTTH